MRGARIRRVARGEGTAMQTGALDLLVSLALVAGLTAAGCGDAAPQAPVSSAGGTSTAASSPAANPSGPPAPRWDAPGSATLAQTLAVTRRYADALQDERIPTADLYVSDAAWDFWASGGVHIQEPPPSRTSTGRLRRSGLVQGGCMS